VADLVTFGETLGLLTAETVGPLRFSRSLALGFGGSESNLAVAATRLGCPAAWLGRVGDDEFGRLILTGLRGEGVDVEAATVDPEARTALMIKERRTARDTSVLYYREGCAGSRLRPAHLDTGRVAAARVLHVTAITAGLSSSALDTVRAGIRAASRGGALTSLDLNYRAALWGPREAAGVMRELTGRTDVVFATHEEAGMVVGRSEPETAAAALAELGPDHAFVKLGARGAVASIGGQVHHLDPVEVPVVDAVGAGDAFAAGYLTALIAGQPVHQRLRRAALAGAFAVTVDGDWEGLPRLDELTLLDPADERVAR
jgi:2-dehydro-3-deoxygluconokinase